MRGKTPQSVVLFRSVSAALAAEKLLKEEGIAFKLIPVPKQISSDCGVCIRINTSDTDRVREVLHRKVEFSDVHELIAGQ